MSRDHRIRAEHYREVLIAMRRLEQQRVYTPTAAAIAVYVPQRNVASVARSLVGLTRHGFVWNEHANAREFTRDSDGRLPKQARSILNDVNRYWTSPAGDIAIQMLEAS